jgi:hypothetical protein
MNGKRWLAGSFLIGICIFALVEPAFGVDADPAPASSPSGSSTPAPEPTPTPTPTPSPSATSTTPLPHEILMATPSATPTPTTNSYGEVCPTVYGSGTRGCPTVPNPDPGCVTGRGLCPGEHAGWALVDENGNVTGGVIVCTPEVCGANSPLVPGNPGYGGGYWGGQRLVLQTVQDPVEAAASANGVGNVAGYSNGARYDFATGQWTLQSGTDIYNMAIAYPSGSDHLTLVYGGTEETPLTSTTRPGEEPQAPSSTWIALSQSFVPPATLQAEYPVVITDAAAERRIDLAAQLVSSLGYGQIGSAVDQAKRLQWVYIWSGLRAMPEDERAAVREDLRTTAISSGAERDLVTMAAGLTRLDLATTVAQAVTDGSSSATTPAMQLSCINALTVGRVRAARAACTS